MLPGSSPTARSRTTRNCRRQRTYRVDDVASGSYQLRIPVRAGLTVGTSGPAFAKATAEGPNGTAEAVSTEEVIVEVVEAASGGPGRAPLLSDGELQLGHIGSSNDLDVYQFTAPGSSGASARILLSNIPDGVDYDLSVYGVRPRSLRGTPTDAQSSLGDVGFDLNPDDDVLATDVVNDIAIDINDIASEIPGLGAVNDYTLRDVSSRRSNNDEEVTIPAIDGTQTYLVVVSGYYGDLSPEPYGLRVRLDRRTALPAECEALPYPGNLALPSVSQGLDVEPGITNTLYVTNSARLQFEEDTRALAEDRDPVDALDAVIGTTGSPGTGILGTSGHNEVRPALLLVDDLTEWTTWNSDRCNPEARNDVVIAIGEAIDGALEDSRPDSENGERLPPSIENIVIVGGDGVIPMAAVPDLTEYSNEATFAGEVISDNGNNTAAAGTVGNGYLLSDDPYATDAGISILGGDHELYRPDRNIGRLVETIDDITTQLDNFARFGGKLDPETFYAPAAVTGYDFLDDGAQAIVAELEKAGFEVESLLQDIDPDTDGRPALGQGEVPRPAPRRRLLGHLTECPLRLRVAPAVRGRRGRLLHRQRPGVDRGSRRSRPARCERR